MLRNLLSLPDRPCSLQSLLTLQLFHFPFCMEKTHSLKTHNFSKDTVFEEESFASEQSVLGARGSGGKKCEFCSWTCSSKCLNIFHQLGACSLGEQQEVLPLTDLRSKSGPNIQQGSIINWHHLCLVFPSITGTTRGCKSVVLRGRLRVQTKTLIVA